MRDMGAHLLINFCILHMPYNVLYIVHIVMLIPRCYATPWRGMSCTRRTSHMNTGAAALAYRLEEPNTRAHDTSQGKRARCCAATQLNIRPQHIAGQNGSSFLCEVREQDLASLRVPGVCLNANQTPTHLLFASYSGSGPRQQRSTSLRRSSPQPRGIVV